MTLDLVLIGKHFSGAYRMLSVLWDKGCMDKAMSSADGVVLCAQKL
jgi:hypothetical protein